MKKVFLITAIVAFCGSMAFGQFVAPGQSAQPALTIPTTGYTVGKATMTTNFASPLTVAIGAGGLGVYALVGSTNANESNLYFRVQYSADAVKWFGTDTAQADGGYAQFVLPIDAVGANAAVSNILTEAQARTFRWARLHSVSNSGYAGGVLSNTVWITNFYFLTAP